MPIRQIPPPITNTWVFIDFVKKLKPGLKKSIHLMNRDLVLWRTQSGIISLVDAYCTHMGAHLGNGSVKGEVLQCIFHNRCFNVEGRCQGFGKDIRSYPISQFNGMIFAWFGNAKPTNALPDFLSGFPDFPDSKWKMFKLKQVNYNFPTKDLLDNTVDAVHFKSFHRRCDSYRFPEILEVTETFFSSKVVFFSHQKWFKKNIKTEMVFTTKSFGPCNLVIDVKIIAESYLFYFKFLFFCTPIQNENTNYVLGLALLQEPKRQLSLSRKMFEYLYALYAFYSQVREFHKESTQVWEKKTYVASPDVHAKESAITEYTTWYNKFYVN